MDRATSQIADKNQVLRELATVIAPVAELLSRSVIVHDENRQDILEPISHAGVVLKDTLSVIDSGFNQPAMKQNGENLANWYVSQTVLDNVCDIYNVLYDSEQAKEVLSELIKWKREKHRGKTCSEIVDGKEVIKDFKREDAGLKFDPSKLDTTGFVVEYMYPRALFAKHAVQANSQGINIEATEQLLRKISLAWITREEQAVLEKVLRKGITVFDKDNNIQVGPYEEIFAEYNQPTRADDEETVKLLHIVGDEVVAVSGY